MSDPRSENILLVEDEPDLLFLLTEALDRAGLRPLTAQNGTAALALARQADRIDLLISDLNIPGVACEQLRKEVLALFPSARVLLISGASGGKTEGWDFLQKPFDLRQFVSKVRQIMGQDS